MEVKKILITGTSAGFGKAMADHLSKLGHHVVGASRNPGEITASYPTLQLDVTKDESVALAIREFLAIHGRIDVLINNAGYGIAGPVEDTSIEEAREQMETNFFGVVRMTRAVLPLMREQKSGLIINISSIAGLVGLPFKGLYCASKFALEGFVEALRIETRPFQIKIVNVNPGDFKTSNKTRRNLVKALNPEYKKRFELAMKLYEAEEKSRTDLSQISLLVERIIERKQGHKVRYLVGKYSQRLGAYLKRHIDSQTFEQLLIRAYKQT